MKKPSLILFGISTLLATTTILSTKSWAADQIIRTNQSIRSAGMGGVRITTGLYDENFNGNPARVTANPTWKVQLPPGISVETNSSALSNISQFSGSEANSIVTSLASTAGQNTHARIQMNWPAFYLPTREATGGRRWALGLGMLTSIQMDTSLRKSFFVDPQMFLDTGIYLNFGMKFLSENRLSVGITPHYNYRAASKETISLTELLQGNSLQLSSLMGLGSHIDADLGATYLLPWTYWGVEFLTGASINNILGGAYNKVTIGSLNSTLAIRSQPRTFNFGIAARRASWWKFSELQLALEFTDIGNNPGGSPYKLVHFGGEAKWSILRPRLGINQGYWTAGLGMNLWIMEVDLATYGEEMSLNAGGLEDRRYAFRVSFQI